MEKDQPFAAKTALSEVAVANATVNARRSMPSASRFFDHEERLVDGINRYCRAMGRTPPREDYFPGFLCRTEELETAEAAAGAAASMWMLDLNGDFYRNGECAA